MTPLKRVQYPHGTDAERSDIASLLVPLSYNSDAFHNHRCKQRL